jgi:hypothetical protein
MFSEGLAVYVIGISTSITSYTLHIAALAHDESEAKLQIQTSKLFCRQNKGTALAKFHPWIGDSPATLRAWKLGILTT